MDGRAPLETSSLPYCGFEIKCYESALSLTMKLRTLQSNGSCSDLSVKRSHALTHTLPCHPLSSKLEQHKNKHHAALNKTCDKDHQFIAKALIEVVNQVSQ